MVREIKLTVHGDTVHASRHRAGIQGEANATVLVVSFDESWDGYEKHITFWDALEQNPVKRILTYDLLVDAASDMRTFKTTIPGEPLALAGECLLIIDGYADGKRPRSLPLRLTVEKAPLATNAGDPVDPIPEPYEQLQVQIEVLMGDVQTVAQGVEEVRKIAVNVNQSADAAAKSNASAQRAAERAEGYASHTPTVGWNGNWWEWNGTVYVDTGKPSRGPKGEDGVTSEETDTKYFDIDYDGIVSLKPEYRGRPGHELEGESFGIYPYAISDNGPGVDGSKIEELPEEIVIPEVINGIAVAGFQPGMFYANFRVKKIVLPNTVVSLPDLFCNEARYLREVRNTEHIRELGKADFRCTRIEKALFPNLRFWGEKNFCRCVLLRIADIGNYVASVPARTFGFCKNLSLVLGGGSVKTIEDKAFQVNTMLRRVPFLPLVTHIGKLAFSSARVAFDWDSLTECEFEERATPVIDNTNDYWSGASFTPCENRLLTLMNQKNPLWKDLKIGIGGVSRKYSNGCATFSLLHIHSALTGRTYDTPMQFVDELKAMGWNLDLGNSSMNDEGVYYENNVALCAMALGYAVSSIAGDTPITREKYQELCDKLAFGAYAYVVEGLDGDASLGHAVIVYGMNEIGEVLIADSDPMFSEVNLYNEGFTTHMPLQNFTGPTSDITIIEKLDGPTVRVSEASNVRYLDGTDDVLTARVEDGVLFVDGDFSARVENGVLYVD